MNGADSYSWTEDPAPYVERIPLMFYIGIDPGASGGIAIIDDRGVVVETRKMPDTDRDLWDMIHGYGMEQFLYGLEGKGKGPTRAVLEKVNAGVFGKPGQRMGVTSAFTFGIGVGRLRMALIAAGIPFDEVLPMKWQTVMACRSGGNKNITKSRAQQLFPRTEVTHAIADALLLAEYGRRTERQNREADYVEKKLVEEGIVTRYAKDREVGDALEASLITAAKEGRREGAARRAAAPPAATGTATRRRRGSRQQSH